MSNSAWSSMATTGLKKPLLIAGAVAAIAFAPWSAMAQTAYDTTLASPGVQPPGNTTIPGVYFGSGNANTDFTVDNGSLGIELGLSAITRFAPPAIVPNGSTPNNVYVVPTGATSVSPHTGSAWGFDFSIDLNPGGNPADPITLSDITATLQMTDLNTGSNGSFDPLLIGDNTAVGPSGVTGTEVETADWAAQNSEALSFASISAAGFLDPLYDINAPDTYTFTLTVTCKVATVCGNGNTPLGSDTIIVDAVPEPATLSLLGVGLVGLAATRRKRRA